MRRRMVARVTYTIDDPTDEDEFRAAVTEHLLRMFNGYSANVDVDVRPAEKDDT